MNGGVFSYTTFADYRATNIARGLKQFKTTFVAADAAQPPIPLAWPFQSSFVVPFHRFIAGIS
jgi:hypothetical protein